MTPLRHAVSLVDDEATEFLLRVKFFEDSFETEKKEKQVRKVVCGDNPNYNYHISDNLAQ